MIYLMNLIMDGAHLFPYILPTLSLEIIILTVDTSIVTFILSDGAGSIWGK